MMANSSTLIPLCYLAIGLVVGATISWLILRGRVAMVAERTRASLSAELATLQERLTQIPRLERMATERESRGESLQSALAEVQRDAIAATTSLQEELEKCADLEARLGSLEIERRQLQGQVTALHAKASELDSTLKSERRAFEEKITLLNEAKAVLSDSFKALSSEALKSNNESFLVLAQKTFEGLQQAATGELEKRHLAVEQLSAPIQQSLQQVGEKLHELEKTRVAADEGLREHLRTLSESQTELRREAANLVTALRSPRVRGRWGEIQLKRVVEVAGMLENCDFYEQQTNRLDGELMRPDMLVRIAGAKNIIVDAKAPLEAYLEAIETQDENVRKQKMKDHARQVRDRMVALSRKEYWDRFTPTPEFTVLFLPGEAFYSAALEHDPGLIESGTRCGSCWLPRPP